MASAAVEMVTLSHCRKMMVFSTDFGLDSDTDTEQVSVGLVNGVEGKRILSEAEDDQDKCHVKKRRKQSKPVRIASSESHSDIENYDENDMTEKQSQLNLENSSTLCKTSVIESGNIVTWSSSDERCKVETGNEINENYEGTCNREEEYVVSDHCLGPINLSNSKCPPNNGYIATQNTKDANQNHHLERSRQNTDTLSTTFQEPNFESGHFEREILFTATSSSPLSFPTARSVHNVHTPNNGSSQLNGSPVRIFNPEAFCDLCNKEFCNKYFLKTHKANKHGIYTESIGTNLIEALPALPFINYFTNVNEASTSSSQIARTVLRKSHVQVVPSSLSQQNPVLLQKSFQISSNGNTNTRAFCNICQREFCNKYFVRRHKAKIHGIIDPDTPPSEVQEQKGISGNDIKLCPGNHDKSEDDEIYSSFSDQQVSVVSTKEMDKHDDGFNENQTFTSTNNQQNAKHSKETDSDSCTSPGVLRNLSPLQTVMTDEIDGSDKNKRCANSEAFCDICNKEYCNKYFLRTHKMKSHGMGITRADWDKRDENSISHLSSHNMPLNLIMADQTVGKIGKDEVDPYCNIFCNVCGQKFKDMFLLKMHVSYAHPQEFMTNENSDGISNEKNNHRLQPLKPNGSIKTETTIRMSNMDSDEKNPSVDFTSSTSLLQCEICRKSFDSSSFDMHIESEHGILLEEVGISTLAEDNSNSQIFQKEIKYECAMCQKLYTSASLLNQHIIEYHGTTSQQVSINNMKKEPDELLKMGQPQGVTNANPTEVQTTPTSSFCEICKKELCNKYFMKTHMQRMHGISIDNGAHIGGVVCDICNKELCSKYFLRVHKQNSHGIVDEILGLDMSRNNSPGTGTDASLKPVEQGDLNNRYFSHFTEVCTICSRRFRSMKWLKAHLLNDHGDEGKDKWKDFHSQFEMKQLDRCPQETHKKSDMTSIASSQTNINDLSTRNTDNYSSVNIEHDDNNVKNNVFTSIFNNKSVHRKQYHCSYCPFSTSILAFLFVHERSHINGSLSNSFLEQSNKLQCKMCWLTFDSEDTYEKHCISHTLSEDTVSTSTENVKSNRLFKVEPTKTSQISTDCQIMTENSGDFRSHKHTGLYKVKMEDSVNRKTYEDDVQTSDGARRETSECESNNVFLEGKQSVSEERPRQKVTAAEVDDEVNVALTRVKDSLELIANKTDIPVSLSVPHSQNHVIMQPFVLEDVSSTQFISMDVKKAGFKQFLSSIVFLPVTERFTNPVTVSFKLTPTL